jgi:metal-responsive CopG/Arc/MetJ family transcriptional regulator
MRIRIPLIIEESIIKEIDEIAGEKHRRAATIETALREYIARQARKAKTAGAAADPKKKETVASGRRA